MSLKNYREIDWEYELTGPRGANMEKVKDAFAPRTKKLKDVVWNMGKDKVGRAVARVQGKYCVKGGAQEDLRAFFNDAAVRAGVQIEVRPIRFYSPIPASIPASERIIAGT